MTVTLSQPSARSGDDSRYSESLAQLAELIAPLFRRREPFLTAVRYIASLLSVGHPANSWQRASATGEASPWRMQRLLNRASWDDSAVRDVVGTFAGRVLGHPEAVVMLHESTVVKKGENSVAVARQYASAAGRVENCQIAISATYASPLGHAVVDHALYLPRSWADNPERCRKAGVPEDRMAYQPKSELAVQLVLRLVDLGLPVRWVCADQVFARGEALRGALDSAGLGYVLKVSPGHPAIGHLAPASADLVNEVTSRSQTWARLPVNSWQRGAGESIVTCRRPDERRARFYLTRTPGTAALSDIARVITGLEVLGKDLADTRQVTALDRYEVRTWTAWHRHATLAMAALSVRAAEAAREGA